VFSADRWVLARFEQEARSASALNHPNIVTIYDIGSAGDSSYFAMELIDGRNLRELVKGGPLPFARLIRIAAQIADAIACAHAAGIVHRDLKPENIMFRADDSLAIVDFGIAKQVSDASSITQAGHILGTPYYLSPEQAKGETLDERSDLYSTGIMFFEMLARRRPFQADTPIAMVHKHINEPIPRLPAGLERYQELVDCLMAKDPASRFANARKMADYVAELKGH
jgi:serine/threonine-protein kinase PpkA